MKKNKKSMKKSTKLLLLVAVLLAAVGGLVLLKLNQDPGEESSDPEMYEEVWENDADYIARILVECGSQSYELDAYERDGATIGWYNPSHPTKGLDDKYLYIITTAENVTAFDTVLENADEKSLGIYGLADPYAKITVIMKDGTQMTGLFGDLSPNGSYSYVMKQGDDTIYTCTHIYRDYMTYTENQIFDLDITDPMMNCDFICAYLEEAGKDPVGLMAYTLNDDAPMALNKGNSLVMFTEPYNFVNVVPVATLLTDFFSQEKIAKINPIEMVSIEATNEEIDSYCLGDNYKYFVSFTMQGQDLDENGNPKQYTSRYIFGNFSEDGESVYFREDGNNTVFLVSRASLEQFDFNAFDYASPNVYLNNIANIATVSFTMNNKSYSFSPEAYTIITEDNTVATRYKIHYMDRELDGVTFSRDVLAEIFFVRGVKEYKEKPNYDVNDSVTIAYSFLDGSEKVLNFYRYDDFNYVIEVDEGIWWTVNQKDLKNVDNNIREFLG